MKISNALSDKTIMQEIGERISRRRLDFQLTQAMLAKEAGVSKRTVERVEAGETAQLSTIIRIFRVLELLPVLDQTLPRSAAGPIELMQGKGKPRKRASSKGRKPEKGEWTWGDES